MATVYVARELEQSGLQRTVALKVMHEHLSRTERYRKRFLDEARILSRLSHPFVCRVFSYGEDDERPYMAMEYLVGEPLSRVLRAVKHQAQNLSPADRAALFGRVIADLAEGVHAAHETRDSEGQLLGVIHRDVSPQNLFMMYDGTVRILDFGIAWYRDRYVQTATTSRLIGKLPYMAPEQVQGADYDRRVDIWALGVVLWELVTLERLFRRETEVQTMEAVCFEPIPFIGEVVEGIAAGFDNIMARALQRDPDKRYQTAREFAHDLEVWLAHSGQTVTHADLSRVLSGLLPGSEQERRRWADAPPHSGGKRQIPQVDFVSEALAALDVDTPSLSLPQRMVREQDLVSSEFTPPPQFARRGSVNDDANREKATHEVERADLFSTPPPTNASPVAISVREPAAETTREPESQRPWRIGRASAGLTIGLLIGVSFWGRRSLENAEDYIPLAMPLAAAVSSAVLPESPADVNSSFVEPFVGSVNTNPLGAPSSTKIIPEAPSNQPMVAGPAATSTKAAPAVQASARAADSRAPKASSQTSTSRNSPQGVVTTPTPNEKPPALGNGDVLIVSTTPGLNVYLGSRFIGQTPLRTRLPVGTAELSVQVSAQGPRTLVRANVAAGRLNIVSLK